MDVHDLLEMERQIELAHERDKRGEPYIIATEPVEDLEEYEPKDTTFKYGDERAVEAGRLGGIRSGEARRRKAEAKRKSLEYTADAIYTQWLQDVTVEEVEAFISWRGQQKRSATIAKQRMKNIRQNGEEAPFMEKYAKQRMFCDASKILSFIRHGISQMVTIAQAREQAQKSRSYLHCYVRSIVDDMTFIAWRLSGS